jgi:3-hydroxyisobutyrate dehydrogenase
MRTAIGFIGLGKMGWPIASHFAQHHDLVVNDLHGPTAQRFADTHHRATAVRSPAEVAAGASTVVTMVPDGAAVRAAVIDGDDPLVRALVRGDLVIDMSSSAPADTVALGARLAEHGVRLVDAPVSGGVTRAVAGTLAVMVGGADDDVAAVSTLVAPVAGSITPTGRLGSAHAMKALNNLLSAAGLAATAEVLAAGASWGLDREVMLDVLNASSGRNNSTETKIRQFVYSGTFGSGFALSLMVKDIATALDLVEAEGTPAAMARATVDTWRRALGALPRDADHTQLAAWLGAPSDAPPNRTDRL